MRRAICITEPNYCLAGEEKTFKFIFTPAVNLSKGAKLRFDMMARRKEMEWEIPSVNLKDKKSVIWAELPDGKILSAKTVEKDSLSAPFFEFTLPSEIKAGENLTILIGSPQKEREGGSRVQTFTQRRRPFHLLIDPRGKGDFKEEELFHIDVRGNELKHIRVVAPSIIGKNKRFDMLVRFEDQYGNLTHNAPEETLIQIQHENMRENLNWKLKVSATGSTNIPNHYFNEAGWYKIQLYNTLTKETFYSHPIKCFAEIDVQLFWGLFHGEFEKVDSAENIESALRLARDENHFDFFATSCFESAEETPNEVWKGIGHQIAEFNEEQRFNTFLGFQFLGDVPEEGLRTVVFFKENKQIPRKKDSKTSNLKKLYKAFSPKEILSIPSFTMGKKYQTNFSEHNPAFEPVVEIYNAWGSSECSAKEGNTRPICTTKNSKSGIQETEEGSLIKALQNNCRFGFVAGGLDDRGIYSGLYESDQVQYSPGLTAILATDHTKEALLQALHARSCYATTGARMVLGMNIAGARMGGELNTKTKPGLVINRHITFYAAGTEKIKEIVILRNGVPLKILKPNELCVEMAYDDSEVLSQAVLAGSGERPHFVFYYLRVTQEDGHIGWTSPIWIDYPDLALAPPPKKAKKGAKS